MNVELKNRNIYWEIDEAANNYKENGEIDFSKLDSGILELIDGAESYMKMIQNRRSFKDKEFFDNLLKIAFINDFNENDCLHVLELVHNLKFVGFGRIKTTMKSTVRKTEGRGKSFDWWEEIVGVDYKILYTKDFTIDNDHIYTISEIKKLLEEKKIVIVSEEERSLAWYSDIFTSEEYYGFDYAYDRCDMEHKFLDKTGEFYLYTLKYIRKSVKRKKLIELFKAHILNTNLELRDATNKNNWNNFEHRKVVEEYSKEFEKNGYERRLRILSEFNNKI